MKQGAIIRRVSRWKTWTSLLKSRYQRHADVFRMSLLLYLRSSRAAVKIEQRWLRPILDFRPQLHWWTTESSFSSANRVFLSQLNFLTRAQMMTQPSAKQEAIPVQNLVYPSAVSERTHALMRVVDHSQREFATLFERRFVERRDTVSLRTSERLVHRRDRVERMAVHERTMTLHRQPGAVTSAPAEVASRPGAGTPGDRTTHLPAPPPPMAMPNINVNELTDQVIRQIDRRVIARRERMGRT
jgi:hypothetical protein